MRRPLPRPSDTWSPSRCARSLRSVRSRLRPRGGTLCGLGFVRAARVRSTRAPWGASASLAFPCPCIGIDPRVQQLRENNPFRSAIRRCSLKRTPARAAASANQRQVLDSFVALNARMDHPLCARSSWRCKTSSRSKRARPASAMSPATSSRYTRPWPSPRTSISVTHPSPLGVTASMSIASP